MNQKTNQKQLKELNEIIENGETEEVEFKKSTAQLEKGMRALCAFLNHKGGAVYFGIDNKTLVGQQVSDPTLRSISQKVRQKIKPEITPEITVHGDGREKVIKVTVKEGLNKLYYLDGVAYKRVGTENPVIPPEEIERIIMEKRNKYWDSEICEGACMKDIDEEKVKWFLDERFSARKIPHPSQMNVSDFLRNICCAKIVNKEVVITNSGILFFGKNPQIFMPFRILCARFRGDELSRTTIDSIDCSGTLWEMLKQAEGFVKKNVRLFGFRTGLSFRRIDKLEYPAEAVREVILNALIHREYTIPSDIRIFIFDSRIEIISPGRFPEGVTPQKPLHMPRNPILCQLMREIGYIEKYGTGIYFVRDLCNEWGIPEPEFETGGLETRVIFRSSGEGILIPEMKKRGIELNDRQVACLHYFTENPYITNKKYQELNNVGKKAAYIDIHDLLDKGLITQEGKGRSVRYIKKF